MKISILFNWPPGENSARVSVGRQTQEDTEKNFRVGIVPKGERDKISWLKNDSIINDRIDEFTTDVSRGDKVVVDLIEKTGASKRSVWDTEEKWPIEAMGASSTEVPWYFC